MNKIVLAGDSWSCGEWVNIPNTQEIKISHLGIEEYLKEKFSIVNLSRCGVSNWYVYYSIETYLRHAAHSTIVDNLKIIVFQTDALRDYMAEKNQIDYDNTIINAENVFYLYQSLTEAFYVKLNSLASRYNIKIYLSGGLTDIDLETVSLYPNLVVMCTSWIKLLNTQHQESIIPLIIGDNTVIRCKKNNRNDLCEELFYLSDKNFPFAFELMSTDLFGPAWCDFHPSRKSHKIMADYIENYFSNNSESNCMHPSSSG